MFPGGQLPAAALAAGAGERNMHSGSGGERSFYGAAPAEPRGRMSVRLRLHAGSGRKPCVENVSLTRGTPHAPGTTHSLHGFTRSPSGFCINVGVNCRETCRWQRQVSVASALIDGVDGLGVLMPCGLRCRRVL